MTFTKAEATWIKKVQSLLDECPERLGFYTIGDPSIFIFDRSKEHLFNWDRDMPLEVDKHGADLGSFRFKSPIHGVCG